MIDIMKQGLGAPHAPTRALRKLARVEEFWWAVQDSNSTATPQAGQQNGQVLHLTQRPAQLYILNAQGGVALGAYTGF